MGQDDIHTTGSNGTLALLHSTRTSLTAFSGINSTLRNHRHHLCRISLILVTFIYLHSFEVIHHDNFIQATDQHSSIIIKTELTSSPSQSISLCRFLAYQRRVFSLPPDDMKEWTDHNKHLSHCEYSWFCWWISMKDFFFGYISARGNYMLHHPKHNQGEMHWWCNESKFMDILFKQRHFPFNILFSYCYTDKWAAATATNCPFSSSKCYPCCQSIRSG